MGLLLLTKAGHPTLFIVNDQNIAAERSVTTGVTDDGWVAITTGLEAGEKLVLSGAGFLKDQDQVLISGG